jgi:two-component system, OmpR family, KDP operon response regulator KdpE
MSNRSDTRTIPLVVIVEDDPDILFVMKTVFEKMDNCIVQTATNGHEGLRLIQDSLPDLAILDFGLPDLRGDALLAQLRQDGTTQKIPVFMVTGNKEIGHCEELGANKIFYKPFNVADLRANAAEFLPAQAKQGAVS